MPLSAALSFVLSLIAAVAAHRCAARTRSAYGWRRGGWIGATALALGGGAIWSAHVVEMFAHGTGTTVAVDGPLSAVPPALAVVAAAVAVGMVRPEPANPRRLAWASGLVAVAATVAHLVDPVALRVAGGGGDRVGLVVLSGAMAFVAAAISLWALFRTSSAAQVSVASLCAACAWSGTHLTAVAAVRPPAGTAGTVGAVGLTDGGGGLDGFTLGAMTWFACCIALLFLLVAASDRSLAHLGSRRDIRIRRLSEHQVATVFPAYPDPVDAYPVGRPEWAARAADFGPADFGPADLGSVGFGTVGFGTPGFGPGGFGRGESGTAGPWDASVADISAGPGGPGGPGRADGAGRAAAGPVGGGRPADGDWWVDDDTIELPLVPAPRSPWILPYSAHQVR